MAYKPGGTNPWLTYNRAAEQGELPKPPENLQGQINYPNWWPAMREFSSRPTEGQPYWTPRRIARYYNALKTVPYAGNVPTWIDVPKIETAYKYLRDTRRSDWQTWEDDLETDPVLTDFVRDWAPPPLEVIPKWEQDDFTAVDNAIRTTEGPVGEWTNYGIDYETWQKLPEWKKWANKVFRSMPGQAGMQAANLAIAGGSIAGAPGAVVGAGLGAGLGYLGVKEGERQQRMGDAYKPSATYYIMGALNFLYTNAQQAAALRQQIQNSLIDPETYGKVGEILKDIPAAYEAGEGFYSLLPYEAQSAFSNDGKVRVVNIAGEDTFIEAAPKGEFGSGMALVDIRRKLSSGELSPSQVREYTVQKYGFLSEAADLLAGYVLDPLDLIGPVTSGVIGNVADASGNVALAKSFLGPTGANDLLSGYRQYRQILRQMPVDEVRQMGNVTQWFAGLDKQGMDVGLRQKNTGFMDKMFGLTKESRAYGLIRTFNDGLSNMLNMENGNVAGMYRIVDSFSRITPGESVSAVDGGKIKVTVGGKATDVDMPRWIQSAEAQIVPLALKDQMPKVKDHYDIYNSTRPQADVIQRFADALGETPHELIANLHGTSKSPTDFDTVMRRITALAAEGNKPATDFLKNWKSKDMNNAQMKQIADLFSGEDGVAYDGNLWGVQLMHLLDQGAEDWMVKWFGIKPSGWAMRLAGIIKQAQGHLLLGNNPLYLANNAINNVVTMAWEGVLGGMSRKSQTEFLRRYGYPSKLRQGIGAAEIGDLETGIVPGTETGTPEYKLGQRMRSATKAKDGMQKTSDLIHMGDKFQIAAVLSQRLERWSSQNAMVKGLREYWDRAFVPGVGFDKITGDLKLMLDAVEPGLSGRVETAIARGLNKTEIEAEIFTRLDKPVLKDVLTPDEINMMDAFPGTMDDIDRGLREATTDEEIRTVFRETIDSLQKKINDDIHRKAMAVVHSYAIGVQTDGVVFAYDKLDTLVPERHDFHQQHMQHMDDVAAQAESLTGLERANLWREELLAADDQWRQFSNAEGEKWLGVFEGFGAERMGAEYGLVVRNLSDIHDVWSNFYQTRRNLMDEYWGFIEGTDFDGMSKAEGQALTSAKWSEVSEKLNTEYIESTMIEDTYQGLLDTMLDSLVRKQAGTAKANEIAVWRAAQLKTRRIMVQAQTAWRMGTIPEAMAKQFGILIPKETLEKILLLNNAEPIYRMSKSERYKANQKFYREIYRPLIGDMMKDATPGTTPKKGGSPVEGAGKAEAAVEPKPAKEETKAAKKPAERNPEEAVVLKLLSEKKPDFAQVDEAGMPSKDFRLNTIKWLRKWSPEARTRNVKKWSEVTPALVLEAWRAEEYFKAHQPAIDATAAVDETPVVETAPVEEVATVAEKQLPVLEINNYIPFLPQEISNELGSIGKVITLKQDEGLSVWNWLIDVEGKDSNARSIKNPGEKRYYEYDLPDRKLVMKSEEGDDAGFTISYEGLTKTEEPATIGLPVKEKTDLEIQRDKWIRDLDSLPPLSPERKYYGEAILPTQEAKSDALIAIKALLDELPEASQRYVDAEGNWTGGRGVGGTWYWNEYDAIEARLKQLKADRALRASELKKSPADYKKPILKKFDDEIRTTKNELSRLHSDYQKALEWLRDSINLGRLYDISRSERVNEVRSDVMSMVLDRAIYPAETYIPPGTPMAEIANLRLLYDMRRIDELVDILNESGVYSGDNAWDASDFERRGFDAETTDYLTDWWIAKYGSKEFADALAQDAKFTDGMTPEAAAEFEAAQRAEAAREHVIARAQDMRANANEMLLLAPPKEVNADIFLEYLHEVFTDRYPDKPEIASVRAEATWIIIDRISETLAKEAGMTKDEWYSQFVLQRGGDEVTVGDALARTLPADTWYYSQLTRTIEQKMPNKASNQQIRGLLKGLVKEDEMKWTGLDDFLNEHKTATKQEVLDFLRENQVEVKEVLAGTQKLWTQDEVDRLEKQAQITGYWGEFERAQAEFEDQQLGSNANQTGNETKYAQYTMPGGKDYRELLLTWPSGTNKYSTSHWAEPNVLAHVRFDERIDADGKRVLFIEEIQSDWHQAGREKGYATDREIQSINDVMVGDSVEGLGTIDKIEDQYKLPENAKIKKSKYGYTVLGPDGKDALGKLYMEDHEARRAYYTLTGEGSTYKQFEISGNWYHQDVIRNVKGKTVGVHPAPFSKSWEELTIKRMIRWAAENGYDRVAWTTGKMQADRYNLAKQVDKLEWASFGDEWQLVGHKDGKQILGHVITEEQLPDYVGKDIATKLIGNEKTGTYENGNTYSYVEGDDLSVGGRGMESFYDKKIPNIVRKYIKKWGGEVGETILPISKSGGDFELLDRRYRVFDQAGNPVWFNNRQDAIDYGAKIGKTSSVPSFDVTPAMRESAMQGQPLFRTQADWLATVDHLDYTRGEDWIDFKIYDKDGKILREYTVDEGQANTVLGESVTRRILDGGKAGTLTGAELEGLNPGGGVIRGAGGATWWLENGKAVIHAFRRAGVADMLHEYIHAVTPLLHENDLRIIERWYTQEYGRAPKPDWNAKSDPDVDVMEKVARGFERYMTEGPTGFTGAIVAVFAKIKTWMLDIYKSLKHEDIDINLNDEVRGMFDEWLGKEKEAAQEAIVTNYTPPLDEYTQMFEYKGQGGTLRPGFTREQALVAQRRIAAIKKAARTKYRNNVTIKDYIDPLIADGWMLSQKKIGAATRWVLSNGSETMTLDPAASEYAQTVFNTGNFVRNYEWTEPTTQPAPQKQPWEMDYDEWQAVYGKGEIKENEITELRSRMSREALQPSVKPASAPDMWKKRPQQQGLFQQGEDTPLFSGVPERAAEETFAPAETGGQDALFNMREQLPTIEGKTVEGGAEGTPLFAEGVTPAYSVAVETIGDYVYWREDDGTLWKSPIGASPDENGYPSKAQFETIASLADEEIAKMRKEELDRTNKNKTTTNKTEVSRKLNLVPITKKTDIGVGMVLYHKKGGQAVVKGVDVPEKRMYDLEIITVDGMLTGATLSDAEIRKNFLIDANITGQGNILYRTPPVTDTPEFKAWFGDSKVVDDNGQPLVVYHGTNAEFQAFDRAFSKGGPSKFGFWFTDDKEFSGFYGDRQVIGYLRLENPKTLSPAQWDKIRVEHAKDTTWFEGWRDSLIKQGFDGLYIKTAEETFAGEAVRSPAIYAIFDPNQIKSVENRGTFSGQSPNILYRIPTDSEGAPLNEPPAVNSPLGTADELNGLPYDDITFEGWNTQLRPLLEQAQQRVLNQPRNAIDLKGSLDKQGDALLRSYLGKVYTQLADTKMAANKFAESRRDAALLDYSKKTGIENLAFSAIPYGFWYTHTAINWALRALNKPSILANYYRLLRMQQRHESNDGYPQRLKGKVAIPMPWLPDWMGDTVYVDPMRQLFPILQLARPFERAADERNQTARRTDQIIYDMVDNGEITDEQAQEAIEAKAGAIYIKAKARAESEQDRDFQNPFDYAFTLSSPLLPLNWAYKAATGRADEIGQLPFTRLVQNMTAMAGIGGERGVNLEGWIRKGVGLPEVDQYEDFRVNRELSNMVAEGLIDIDTAGTAMIDRTGEAFSEAQRRVSQQGVVKYIGGSLALDLFPEGEMRQRGLTDEFAAAYDAKAKGDKNAVNDFFDKYPEYSSRLMTFKEPEEQLRFHLRGIIWDKYLALPKPQSKEFREAAGDVFEEAFLNSETRSYDSISTDTLAMWANSLGETPEKAGTAELPVDWMDDETVKQIESYYNEKTKLFGEYDPNGALDPNYSLWQNQYLAQHPNLIKYVIGETNALYGLPEEIQVYVYKYRAERDARYPGIFDTQDAYFQLPSNQRKSFLKSHSELPDYWDWRKRMAAAFPKASPYILSEESLASEILDEDYVSYNTSSQSGYSGGSYSTATYNDGRPATGYHPPYLTSTELKRFSAPLVMQLMARFYRNEKLMPGAYRELTTIWEQLGKPFGNLEDFIEYAVKPTITK